MKKLFVILDNGHGNNTAGKRSPKLEDGRQLFEYKWCREVVDGISRKLTEKGIMHNVLVPEIYDVPLSTRVQRANKLYYEYKSKGYEVIFISVHINASGLGNKWMNANYWSVWTSKGQTKGDKLADSIYEGARKVFEPLELRFAKDLSDGDVDMESNFYVLKNTGMPACLTENFFMDNLEGCKFLLSEQGKKLCVDAHILGILDYQEKINK